MANIEIQAVEVQDTNRLEGTPLTPEQREQVQKKMDEIYGKPKLEDGQGSTIPEKHEFKTTGVDEENRLIHMHNDSGTLNIDDKMREKLLASPKGDHTVTGEDGKEFKYTRDADGLTLFTPDGQFGVRLDNEGKVLKQGEMGRQKPGIQVWENI